MVRARRRKLLATAREIGLCREARIDLAEYVLRRDVDTWKTLTDEEVCRLLDTLEGFLLVGFLLSEQGAYRAVAE